MARAKSPSKRAKAEEADLWTPGIHEPPGPAQRCAASHAIRITQVARAARDGLRILAAQARK
jgi:hypothetical protein